MVKIRNPRYLTTRLISSLLEEGLLCGICDLDVTLNTRPMVDSARNFYLSISDLICVDTITHHYNTIMASMGELIGGSYFDHSTLSNINWVASLPFDGSSNVLPLDVLKEVNNLSLPDGHYLITIDTELPELISLIDDSVSDNVFTFSDFEMIKLRSFSHHSLDYFSLAMITALLSSYANPSQFLICSFGSSTTDAHVNEQCHLQLALISACISDYNYLSSSSLEHNNQLVLLSETIDRAIPNIECSVRRVINSSSRELQRLVLEDLIQCFKEFYTMFRAFDAKDEINDSLTEMQHGCRFIKSGCVAFCILNSLEKLGILSNFTNVLSSFASTERTSVMIENVSNGKVRSVNLADLESSDAISKSFEFSNELLNSILTFKYLDSLRINLL